MGRIDDIPLGVTPAGQSFDYPNPPDSIPHVVFVSGNFGPDHEQAAVGHVPYDTFIDAEIAANRAVSFDLIDLDPTEPMRVPLSLSAMLPYNYFRLGIAGYNYYGFCSAKYGTKTVTIMQTRLDPFAMFDWQLGFSMIDRGHVGVATSQGDTYGNLYCTAPEPIEAPPVVGVRSATALSNDISDYTVMVISANDLTGNGSGTPFFQHHFDEFDIGQAAGFATSATADTATGAPQITVAEAEYPWLGASGGGGTFQLYVPDVTPAPAATIDGVAAGGGVYLFTPGGWLTYQGAMQGAPWVTGGIVDIRLVPIWALSGGGSSGSTILLPPTNPLDASWASAAAIPVEQTAVTTGGASFSVLGGWRDSVLGDYGAGIFRKLLTAPYASILIGNGEGGREYRPDEWLSDAIGGEVLTGALHGEMSARVTPDYNQLGEQEGFDVPLGGTAGRTASGYGRAASNTANTDMGPWTSAYASVTGRQVLTDQQALAQTLAITGAQMQMGTQGAQTVINAVGDVAGGNVVGAATAAASYAVAGIAVNNSLELLDIAQDGALDIAAYQLGLSGISTLKAFNAWKQSLEAVSGSGSPEHLASAWRLLKGHCVNVIVTLPTSERVYSLLSMWRRYGYTIGRAFQPSTLNVMSHYSYWKTEGATVIGNLPSEHRPTIEAAFNRGVTLWTDLSLIGTVDPTTNTPITGTYY